MSDDEFDFKLPEQRPRRSSSGGACLLILVLLTGGGIAGFVAGVAVTLLVSMLARGG